MATSIMNPNGLSQLHPIGEISLPSNQVIRPRGLVLVVGPNSSGKTQLLKDIHNSLIGQPRKLVVATSVRIRKPQSLDEILTTLEAEGYLKRQLNQEGREIINIRTVPFGGGSAAFQQDIDISTIQGWFNNFQEGQRNQYSQSFNGLFGAMLCSAMFLTNRLTAANQSSSFDYERESPKNDLQALYTSSDARDQLTRDVRDTFGRGIWIDATRGNVLCFRLTNSSDLPSADDRLRPDRVTDYRVIDDEGDGLRSFVAVCMGLALSRRPVCLIDEPEICLHPPQAYALGRIIARQAAKHDSTTIVATHSNHILRGVIQQTNDVQIVRLTRVAGKFNAHSVDSALLRSATAKPMIKTEIIFDGIFADGVIVVESDGDRAVYQAVWEASTHEPRLDLLFVPVNGKGAMADVAKFFKALRIPVAIIPDLDLIRDENVIPKLLAATPADSDSIVSIVTHCKALAEAIRVVPPTVTPEEVNQEIRSIDKLPMLWEKNDDEAVMRRLRGLANRIDRMRRLKPGGIETYKSSHPEIAAQLESVKEMFWRVGIFLVPVGELEYWFSKDFMKDGPSREKKQEWADEAATRIRRQLQDPGPIQDFIKSIASFIANRETI